jgi:hypothetical protein
MVSVWDQEEWLCTDQRARTIPVPFDGESDRVSIGDVLDRKAWFPSGGVYIVRDEETVLYVGSTLQPLRTRFQTAIYGGKAWARGVEAEQYRTWTVTMQAAPRYPADKLRVQSLVDELKPTLLQIGRPPKRKIPLCGCEGACPTCGRPRSGAPAGP